MSTDRYPYKLLIERLYDVMWFGIAIVFIVFAILIGLMSFNIDSRSIIGLGMAASGIGAYLDYRQKTCYENNSIESSILSNGLQAKGLNFVANLRFKLISANTLLIVVSMWVTGYGVVWGSL